MTGSRRGFTLMEMLVALGLFAVVVTIATDLFLTFQRLSRKTESLDQLVANARLITERIVREVKEGTIDYDQYASTSLALPQNRLDLRNTSNTEVDFVHRDEQLFFNGEPLTSAAVRVQVAQFTIVPAADPFSFNEESGIFASNTQPRVTILLTLNNGRDPGDRDYTRYDVQTTISSRVYAR